jgi:restriction system protein
MVPDTKIDDGLSALVESEKDGSVEKTNSENPKANAASTGAPRQIGLTDKGEAGTGNALRTIPPDLVSIVPGHAERAEKERDRLDNSAQRSAARDHVTQHYSALETPWQDLLLDCLLKMKPTAFERLCQKILKDSGFIKVEVTGRSGDGGIDGIGVLRLNLLSFHVFFQCKRWKGSVGASTIRDFRGAMVGRADKGLVITTGTFTTDARREATRDGAPTIDLVDGIAVCELLKRLQIGVSIRKVEHVVVQQEAFLEF